MKGRDPRDIQNSTEFLGPMVVECFFEEFLGVELRLGFKVLDFSEVDTLKNLRDGGRRGTKRDGKRERERHRRGSVVLVCFLSAICSKTKSCNSAIRGPTVACGF